MILGPNLRRPGSLKEKSGPDLFAALLEDYYRQVLDLKLPNRIFGLARRLTVRAKGEARDG